MKRILIILCSLFLLVTGHAQILPSTPAVDTLTNTDTTTLTLTTANGYYRDYTTQIVATKVSGTPSATIYLQASLDNATWVNVDSLVVTNVATAQTTISKAGPSAYYYYRWWGTTSGTQKFYIKAYLWRKE